MERKWCYFLFLFWISYALILSLLLFTQGFLLHKTTLKNNSSCTTVSLPCGEDFDEACLSETNNYALLHDFYRAQNTCLPQKAKVILLLIDAFRFDFAFYNESAPETPYQNKVPVINDLLKAHPSSTRLYKFIADPPTTTMQRLKALTTGTLPTFIDAGSNFATPEIQEDNIIDQLIKHGKKAVFMGDDTWTGLYPNRFERSYPFPSFNVYDLDTVDTGVTDNLYKEMSKNDWSLLIGHYLGVDHCGHRYGPDHEEMQRKLNEMNIVIKNVTEMLDDDTILIVIGDHGMTVTGDHGGESEDEVTATMFIHSKNPLISSSVKETSKSVKQIDLVPTLATILGVSIPYSNLGYIILDSIPTVSFKDNWRLSLFALWGNVEQIIRYLDHYSKSFDAFDSEHLAEYYTLFSNLKYEVTLIKTLEEFLIFSNTTEELILNLRSVCEKEWTQFDPLGMIRGLLNFFATIFFVFIITDGISGEDFHKAFSGWHLFSIYILITLSVNFSIVLIFLGYLNNIPTVAFFCSSLCSTLMFGCITVLNWVKITEHWYNASENRRWLDQVTRCALFATLCGLFSNSFIIEEGFLLLYLWFSLVILALSDLNICRKFHIRRNLTRYRVLSVAILAFLLMRVSYGYTICREEQLWCYSKEYMLNRNEYSSWAFFTSTIVMGMLYALLKLWMSRTGNIQGYNFHTIVFNYVPLVVMISTVISWFVQGLRMRRNLYLTANFEVFSFSAHVLFFVGIFCILAKPLFISVKINPYDIPHAMPNVIPILYRRIKEHLSGKRAQNVPVACGLGTVFSAFFITLGLFFTVYWALLLGSQEAAPAVFLYFLLLFVVFVTSLTVYDRASRLSDLMNTPNIFILVWSFLSYYFFYSTGHQATFNSIPWNAAFIGTSGQLVNVYLQGALVIINVFGSHILCGILLPLLIIAPYGFQFIWQSCRPKIASPDQMLKGEFLLFENEKLFYNNVCILCAKYILLSAVRVFFSMLTATIHCRHLMVWSIFAPKLLFESVALIVTIISVLLGYLLLLLLTFRIKLLVRYLEEKCR